MQDKVIGFAVTGSFCTLEAMLEQMELLAQTGATLIPIFSPVMATTDTRFGKAAEWTTRIETICGRPGIRTIAEAEPIGPKRLLDLLVVAPCTGNTLAKLYHGITDTSVTMASKAHLRNGRPVVLTIATNDGLGMNGKNIGGLMNISDIYFTPFGQDDNQGKPASLVAHFDLLIPTIEAAFRGKRLQPQLIM